MLLNDFAFSMENICQYNSNICLLHEDHKVKKRRGEELLSHPLDTGVISVWVHILAEWHTA